MEGLYLLGFGPRTARAARDLAGALYPSLAAVRLPSDGLASPAGACNG
jgi:iron complex transport system substrate-binding protein